jgi:hypothetical protein
VQIYEKIGKIILVYIIVTFVHNEVLKKETEALQLKSDSFVVASNVHFPTDYNLCNYSGTFNKMEKMFEKKTLIFASWKK